MYLWVEVFISFFKDQVIFVEGLENEDNAYYYCLGSILHYTHCTTLKGFKFLVLFLKPEIYFPPSSNLYSCHSAHTFPAFNSDYVWLALAI